MIKTEEKFIGGSNYMVTQLPARRALRLKAKLLRILGAPIAQLFMNEEPSKPMTIEDSEGVKHFCLYKEDVVKALPMLFSNLDDKTYELLILELLQGVRKDGMELTESLIDNEFAGELNVLLQVVWFVIEVNFGSFFSEGVIGSESTYQSTQTRQPDTRKTSMKR